MIIPACNPDYSYCIAKEWKGLFRAGAMPNLSFFLRLKPFLFHLQNITRKLNILQRIREPLRIVLPYNSLRARLAKGIFWVIVGSLFRQGTNFLTSIIVARMLAVEGFGRLGVIQSTVLFLAAFCLMGMDLSAPKYVSSLRAKDKGAAGRVMGFTLSFSAMCSLCIGTAVYLFPSWIAGTILAKEALTLEIGISSGWIVFEMINLIQIRLLAGLEAFRENARYSIYQAVLFNALLISGAYLGGLMGAIKGMIIGNILVAIAGQLILRNECKQHGVTITFRGMWKEARILRMSIMVLLSSIATNATNWLSGILLARQPAGILEFGLLSVAHRYTNMLLFFASVVFQVIIPVLANLHAEGNRQGFLRSFIGIWITVVGVTLIPAACFLVFSDQLILLYGMEFAGAARVLRIGSMGCVAQAAWVIGSTALWALEESKQMLALDVARGILLISLCLAGYTVSADRLVLAQMISYCIGSVLLFLVISRCFRRSWVAKG